MRKNGKFMGGKRPYGYKVVGKALEKVTDEQEIIRDMISWKQQGKTIQSVTDTLNGNGVTSATGQAWHYMSVRKILQREA